MLQRLNFSLDEELLPGDGTWNRDELEAMDAAFTRAVLRAFSSWHESPAAAAATMWIGYRNGREAVVERAIGAAWDLLCRTKGQIAAAEIVKFVNERCSGVAPARIRVGLEWRLRRQGAQW
jgi:hypothetical protein